MATVSLFFTACEDDVSGIGGSISSSEITIAVDSLSYRLDAKTIAAPTVESRSSFTLLGSIRVPEYGELDCSFVTQFLPTESLQVPDSIKASDIDSVKMTFTVPKAYITGDTLAPQQLKVYSLTRPLPSDISSAFDPTGYFNPSSPLVTKSYTLSGYSFGDSVYTGSKTVQVKAPLPVEMGREVFEAYKSDPDLFIWPQKFAEKWPGIYVEPSFGKGCIAPVQNTSVYAYFPQTKIMSEKDENGNSVTVYKQVADSVCLFSTAPEVLSSVNISYSPSPALEALIDGGSHIMTTPGGYTVAFKFPARDILDEYWEEKYDLGVINNMVFSIPARSVPNSYGLGIPPAILMIKSSEIDSFFSEGRLPDNKSSFTSIYSAETGMYTFGMMRQYIVNLREKGKDNITDEDVDFTLVPVTVSTEDYTDPNTGKIITAVTSVTPYIIMPTMVELDTDNARVVFTFSSQTLF